MAMEYISPLENLAFHILKLTICSKTFLPSFYFLLKNKKVYIVSSSNTILHPNYSSKVLAQDKWLNHFFDKTKHNGWLIKYNYKKGYKIINKQCDVSTGAQDIPF